MKRLMLIVCAIIVSGVLALPSFAAITPGRGSVSLYGGWYTFDSEVNLKDKPVGGLRIGYDLTERWAWEAAFDYVRSNLDQGDGSAVKVYGYRLDALYHFMPREKLVPYVALGVGGTSSEYTNKSVPGNENDYLFDYGAGVKYFLSEAWALRGDVRNLLVMDGGRSDWEFTLGLTFWFGGKKAEPVVDSDNDGVPDSADKCPNTPKGETVGVDGCPLDSDGDGVVDSLDKCPNTPKGEKVGADGCPVANDSDGDGVTDSLDKCPNTPQGEKVGADGCPLDSDGDGVVDSLDKCPDTPKGVKVDKDGCPEKVAVKVSIALHVEFDSGKADVKAKYHDQIKEVADFMTTYPETTAVIEGHTDNVGKEASNLRLSTRRAESVRTFLIDKFGIAPGRLVAKGFGSSQPIADNATSEGRQKNRRITAVIETVTMH